MGYGQEMRYTAGTGHSQGYGQSGQDQSGQGLGGGYGQGQGFGGGYGQGTGYGAWHERQGGPFMGRGPRGYSRSDDRIREDVNDRLTDDPWVDASDIDVQVRQGIVTLSGRVDSREAKRRAEDIAESCSGVRDVTNQIRVEKSEGILDKVGEVLTGEKSSNDQGSNRRQTASTNRS
jgi:hypothetical protein